MWKSLASVLVVAELSACAMPVQMAWTGLNLTSTVTTDKSLTDHGLTTITGANCDVRHVVTGEYYCERVREPGTTYNRSSI
jgi:hypothetical protein